MYELPLPATIKRLIRQLIPESLWLRLKEKQRQAAFDAPGPYSFDEPAILRQIDAQPEVTPFFVDIGAQDGVLGSQTLALAKRGWRGVNYEADTDLFEGMKARYAMIPAVKIRRELVTPDTVSAMLERDGVPRRFGFLSLDIDSFDYYVLEAVLGSFEPSVICVEINEMIPPPIEFKVDYHEDTTWSGDSFQGFSIQAAKSLCHQFGYVIGELHHNNLLLVKSAECASVSDEDIARTYADGYVLRSDRIHRFPWNAKYEGLLTASPETAFNQISELFRDRLDRCQLSLHGKQAS